MRFIVSVKYAGNTPVFYGPLDGLEQAKDWADGARRAWPDAAVILLALESPWDA